MILLVEAVGSLAMWTAIPLAWLWIGARVYTATGSLGADGAVAFFGSVGTILLMVASLRKIDGAWVALRRQAGHDQVEGMLSHLVVASVTIALVVFLAWYYLFSHAYVLPFMGPP